MEVSIFTTTFFKYHIIQELCFEFSDHVQDPPSLSYGQAVSLKLPFWTGKTFFEEFLNFDF